MFKRCQHQWTDEAITFTPPLRVTSVKNMEPKVFMPLVYGFTTTKQRCSECKEIAFRTTPGDVR